MNKSVLAPKLTGERCYYVDWLRVLAMLLIFLFHCARFFDHGGWHVKNATKSHTFCFRDENEGKIQKKKKKKRAHRIHRIHRKTQNFFFIISLFFFCVFLCILWALKIERRKR
jgi:peptidoglycan/LPS O-acetylase OafA/YrhL